MAPARWCDAGLRGTREAGDQQIYATTSLHAGLIIVPEVSINGGDITLDLYDLPRDPPA
jgi:hypothetical protein